MTATTPNGNMTAMVLEAAHRPLQLQHLPLPKPDAGQVLIKVRACGICRTDLHIIDGELANPKLPLIPGHEIIGEVMTTGDAVDSLWAGDVVGVPWLAYTCGSCRYCLSGRENLCDQALFTGYTINGGFATHCIAWAKYCFKMPRAYTQADAAPLLCAGLIGYRSYNMLPAYAKNIGFWGFGASAHILAQLAKHEGRHVYAFTKDGDTTTQAFALQKGAVWAGNAGAPSPCRLDASIIFAADGRLVPKALAASDKGGCVICAGIHMSDIPAFPYELLWQERSIRSVANLTREDGERFLQLAPTVPVTTTITTFPLEEANKAIETLRNGSIKGAAVLTMP